MKRGVSFLLQNMTMLTDNCNLLRPLDKQKREKKENKARNIIFYRAQFYQRSLYFLLFGRPLKTFLALRLPQARLTERK